MLSRLARRGRTRFERFAGRDEAVAASTGYEDDRIVDVVVRKTTALVDRLPQPIDVATTQNALAIALATPEGLTTVLELGGGGGAALFLTDYAVPGKIGRWTVLETPAMATKGSALFANDRLQFVSSLESLDARIDTAIAQGVLQYMPDPLESVAGLAALQPRFLCVGRTLTMDGDGVEYLVQKTPIRDHGPGAVDVRGEVTIPLTLVPYMKLIDVIASTHDIIVEFDPGPVQYTGSSPARERGFIAALRER